MSVNQFKQITQALEGDEELKTFFNIELSTRNNLMLFFLKIRDLEPEIIRNIISSFKIVEDEEEKYLRRKGIS